MADNGSLNGRRRVVVTGMGAVSPLGLDVQTTWERLLAGESGATEITHFDHTDYKVHFACEVKDFDPTNWIDRKDARRMDRFAHLVLAAAIARCAKRSMRRASLRSIQFVASKSFTSQAKCTL